MRSLYDWTLHWADRPQGSWALFLIAFAESSFFPIPPDVLLIALCVGSVTRSYRFAAICTLGSLLGGCAGYAIGYYGYEWIGVVIVKAYHGEAVMAQIKQWYDQWGFWGNLTAAVTPIPYKVFTIASGLSLFLWGIPARVAPGPLLEVFVVATPPLLAGGVPPLSPSSIAILMGVHGPYDSSGGRLPGIESPPLVRLMHLCPDHIAQLEKMLATAHLKEQRVATIDLSAIHAIREYH